MSKRYARRLHGDVVAASGVNLDIGPDETFGIIGPNGAGKTTLLRLIAGITSPDEGRIERTGRTLALIELGAGLHPDLTGAENVGFAGSLAGMSRRQIIERREKIVDFSGLGDDIHRPIKHYSNGMLARLAFSVAVHADPDLLLIDEVLAVGDLDFQRDCFRRIDEMRDGGCTVVLVTHDLSTVGRTCDRAALIEQGRLVATGSPADVVSEYLGAGSSTHEALRLEVTNSPLEPRGILQLRIRSAGHRRLHAGTLGIEIMLPLHPAASVEESHSGPHPIASVELDGDWSKLTDQSVGVDVDTTGLPPGRYLVRCSLIAAGSPDAVSNSADVRIRGVVPERPEIPLDGEFTVQALDPPTIGDDELGPTTATGRGTR